MKTFRGAKGIEYNEEMINEETLSLWTSFKVPESLKQVESADVEWLSEIMHSAKFLNNDVAAFYDDAAVRAAVKDAIDYIKSDAEYSQLLLSARKSDDLIYQEVYDDLKAVLLSPAVDETIADTNFKILDHIKISTDKAGIFECQIGGEILLRADTKTLAGMNATVIFQIALVFVDFITIVMAAAGILAEAGKEIAKRFVKFVGTIESWFMKMMESFWAKLKPLMDKVSMLFKTSGDSAKWITAVKEAAKDIAQAIAAVISWAKSANKLKELESACTNLVGIMLNSTWKKIKAACMLIASVILLCVSAGTSLILKIIQLVAGLVSFILDLITLIDLMHESLSIHRNMA